MNVLLAEQITEQAEYCALIFGAADVAPLDVIVTPEPAANVTCPVYRASANDVNGVKLLHYGFPSSVG